MNLHSSYNYFYQDHDFHPENPLGESEYIYAQGLGADIWDLVAHKQEPLKIAEIGFGFGRNFLVFCKYFAQQIANHPQGVDYIGIESHPKHYGEFLTIWHELAPYSPNCQELLSRWSLLNALGVNPPEQPHHNRHVWHFMAGKVRLHLIINQAQTALDDLMVVGKIHGWCFNGYRPDKNPQAWHENLLPCVQNLSCHGAVLCAHYAPEFFTKNLELHGFAWQIRPSFLNNKQILRAVYQGQEQPLANDFRHAPHEIAYQQKQKIVIHGAQLAGIMAHQALKIRGIAAIMTFDPDFYSDSPPIAVLHPHQSLGHEAFGQFSETAYHFAFWFWANQGEFQRLNHALMHGKPRLYEFIARSGLQCQAINGGVLLNDSGIVILADYIRRKQQENPPIAIQEFQDDDYMPIYANGRGSCAQLHYPHSQTAVILREYENIHEKIVAAQAILSTKDFYSFSAFNNRWIGSLAHNSLNLDAQAIYNFRGTRLKSGDSNPLIGAIADKDAFLAEFHDIHHGKKFKNYRLPPVQSYMLSALGGKGLSHAPLGGEIIASIISNGVLPIGKASYRALNPMRFLIRKLKQKN